jgi:glucose/arabinose dehydrogenase
MNAISSSRRALLSMLVLVAAVACMSGGADVATSAPPSTAKQKLASCMKAKGFTGTPTQAERASANYRAALQACAKKLGLPGRGASMGKYISCMAKHGVVISPASKKRPNRSSAAYKKANAACASLRNT